MSDSRDRGGPYHPPQGQGSYGPPPPYQGPQGQQPRQQRQPQQQWQQPPQPQQQWQQPSQPQQQGWGQQPSYDESYGAPHDQYGGGSYGDDLALAPILRRAGARVIDNALVAVFGFALVLPVTIGAFGLGKPGSKTEDDGGVWNWPIIFTLFCVLSVLPFLYEAIQLSMSGRTLGKRVMGIGIVQSPGGQPLTTTQAVWRAGIVHVGYQLGVFFFLVVAVMVWDYAAYGMLLVWAGALMAYLWAIWDQPLHQSLHDRFAGTLVIDERAGYDEYDEYTE
ncbi:RDD family protein [Actinomadura chibensis]|uniref:RDD family protein n=1 Tax=Actinomadura chibensis TaxID=392828 RepID=A0A5D0NWG5_9ACTN|nr:RDD family protein [Actinomadura chibensis]